MTIAIVGLGYVGLPLALQFARNGLTVIGLDVDVVKVSARVYGPQKTVFVDDPICAGDVEPWNFHEVFA